MAAHNVNLRRPSVRSEKDAAQAKIVFEAARKGDALLVFDSLLKEKGAKGALKRVLPSSALVGIRALRRKWNK